VSRAACRGARGLFLAAAAFFSSASTARGHIGHVITRAERYLKLDATEADTRFVVSLTLGAAEGRQVLALADTDESGAVDEAEMGAYLASWSEGLRTELPIEVDGAPLEVTWGEGWMDPIGAVRSAPVTVEMVAHLPLTEREHRVVVRDRMVRREVFDRTDVAFRAHDGAELVRCGPSAEPPDVEDDAAFLTGGAALDLMTADLRFVRRSATSPRALGLGGGLVVLVVLVLAAVFRRRAQSPMRGQASTPASRSERSGSERT
jgi:hypothetical protein